MSQYPPKDIANAAGTCAVATMARISKVAADSPAYDAGFEPGCYITSVDGQPIRDIIDWRWLTGEECITVGYVDLDGDAGEVELGREPGEDWGFEFEGLVFDDVKQCRNACTFCFMRQLPAGMRPSLSLRDDDFRLSFLVGTFVTLTGITPAEEARIIEQRISPLRVSLQAANPEVRTRLIGKHAQHGIDALDRLLAAGIEFHAQIVLVPEENDGEVLRETLAWAYERPGILDIGIVPLGYTKHQDYFDRSFNSAQSSQAVLGLIEPFQQRALEERNTPWVFAADEFYRNAHGAGLLDKLPPASFYGDFPLFEDGIGIIRSVVDDWDLVWQDGTIARCARALRDAGIVAHMVAGYAQREFLDALIARADIADVFQPLYVKNDFFGGNVDVTGLLVGEDIVNAVRGLPVGGRPITPEAHAEAPAPRLGEAAAELARRARSNSPRRTLRLCSSQLRRAPRGRLAFRQQEAPNVFLIPRVVFNDDGITLDDMTLADMEDAASRPLHMVSCSPKDYFNEIIAIIAG